MYNKYKKGCWPWQKYDNKVVVKDKLGSTKEVVVKLPNDNHTYGDKVPFDGYQAQNLIYQPLQFKSSSDQPHLQPDLRTLNKACITNQLATAPQFYKFRKQNGNRRKAPAGSLHIPIALPEKQFAYGLKIVPEPTKLILTNAFMNSQEQTNRAKYCEQAQQLKNIATKLNFYKTKGHRLVCQTTRTRLSSQPWNSKQEQLWKMPKFKKRAISVIKPEVQQHRSKYEQGKQVDNEERNGKSMLP